MNPVGCFRGSLTLPPLHKLINTHNLNKKERIRERNQPLALEHLRYAEKKIERKIRSKSHLDSLFELTPFHPWRQTTTLHTTPNPNSQLLELDFKNFHPAILCQLPFPHPARLYHTFDNPAPNQPGITRCLLHEKPTLPERVRELHPFQIQFLQTSAPFRLDGHPIQTLIHTQEIPILSQWFDIEPLESILSEIAIPHPLKNKTLQLLEEIEEARKNPDSCTITLKKRINAFCTTPKIGTPKFLPSPFGIHAFPSQIHAMARTLLFQTIHVCLEIDPQASIIQINTDGFHIQTKIPNQLLQTLTQKGILKDIPGSLRKKSEASSGLFLGPNAWWTLSNNQIVSSRGNSKHSSEPTIPKKIPYQTPQGIKQFPLIHLADFRHNLDHNSLERKKFILPPHTTFQTPLELCQKEKQQSFKKTLQIFNKFRKDHNTLAH